MPRTVSTATMVEQLEGLLHTRDLTIREADFVASLVRARNEKRLGDLSDRQVEWMSDLHRRHFA
jgi:hypothetical protein